MSQLRLNTFRSLVYNGRWMADTDAVWHVRGRAVNPMSNIRLST